jgi:hypothetical protein
MSTRLRLLVITLVAIVLVGGVAAFVARSRADQQRTTAAAPRQSTLAQAAVEAGPRIVFRNSGLGPAFGEVAMVPLDKPGGARALTGRQCDRVFATAERMLCLASDRGIVTTYSATVYATGASAPQRLQLSGSPSRARLSSDGRLASTTSFVAGDSYAAASFSTRTVVTRLATQVSFDLEEFALVDAGRRIAPVERNYWGVTFADDDDQFFVTVAYGGRTHLARGQLSTRRIETMRTDAECPSLSPDGTRVAYKKRGNREGADWRLVVLDLRTGKETQLAEQRSVDDQVEWLDDAHVLYGLPGEGSQAAESNVWVVQADGSGRPSILIPKAWSPAVIR